MLVSLSDMKTFLGISSSTYDTFLTTQIGIISEAITNYCRRTFELTTYTQTFYRDEFVKNTQTYNLIPLYAFPVVSVTSIKDKTLVADAGISVLNYRLNKLAGFITMGPTDGAFFTNGDIMEVVYVAGYATIPLVIQNAVYSLVQERYNKKVSGIDLNFGSDVQSISIPGSISIAYDYSLQNNTREVGFGSILGNYANTLDYYRSERAILGDVRLTYL